MRRYTSVADVGHPPLGVTAEQVSYGIHDANLINGVGSTVSYDDLVPKGGEYSLTKKTVGEVLAGPPVARAAAQAGGNDIYLNPSQFKAQDYYGNQEALFHEVVAHNVANKTDPEVRTALGMKTPKEGTDDITKRLSNDCL